MFKTLQSLFLLLPLLCFGQGNFDELNKIQPHEDYDNILVKKLQSDRHASSFLIWVKNEVKAHRHVVHSEHVYILSGTGTMLVGDEEKNIKSGDMVYIPENMVHSVKVTSEDPLKVLSIQSPEFLGKDRVFEQDNK